MEEEISNTPVAGVTERSEVTAATPLQVSASPPTSVARSDPASPAEDVQTVTSLPGRAAPPSLQSRGRPLAVTNEDLGEDTGHTDQEEASVVHSRVGTLPAPEELARQLRTRFLECVRCRRVFDGQARAPRRLACCHALCDACLQGSSHPEPCPQCPVGSDKWRTVPDLPRLQLLEVLSERAEDCQGSLRGGSAELLCGVLERLLTCVICSVAMEACPPCVLPCMHVLCAACSGRLSRCHECRQSFTAQESAPDPFLQSLLQWLLPYREHIPSLTSHPDDVTTRMYALQELLERREEQIIEQMRGEEQRRAFERFLALFGSRRHVETRDPSVHSAWKNLAETCLETVRETVKADIGSSLVVWSTAKIAYDKMLKHLSSKSGFAQALAETEAVKILTDNLRHPPFLSSTDDEHVRHVVRSCVDILHGVAEQPAARQPFLSSNTAQAAAAFLTMDHVESGLAICAARLLERLCESLSDCRSQLLNQLGGRPFADRCYAMMQSCRARCQRKDQTILETAFAVYKMTRTFSCLSRDFAKGLAEVGAVALLTDNCRQLGLVTEITNENWSFLIEFSIQSLHAIAAVDGTKQWFEQSSTMEAMPGLFKSAEKTHGFILNAMNVVDFLSGSDGNHYRRFGDAVAGSGFAEKLSTHVRLSQLLWVDAGRLARLRTTTQFLAKVAAYSEQARKDLTEAGFVAILTENLRCPALNSLNETKEDVTLDCVGFLLQLSWDPNALPSFQSSRTRQVLEPFLQEKRNEVLRHAAFMAIINTDGAPVPHEKELAAENVTMMRKAMESSRGAYYGGTHYLPTCFFFRTLPNLILRRVSRTQIEEMNIIPELDAAATGDDAEVRHLASLCKSRLLGIPPEAMTTGQGTA